MASRTGKGNVTEEARQKSGDSKGKYPIFDQKSCISAVKLRHNGKGVSAESVLSRASRWASAHNNGPCKAAIERARKADKE